MGLDIGDLKSGLRISVHFGIISGRFYLPYRVGRKLALACRTIALLHSLILVRVYIRLPDSIYVRYDREFLYCMLFIRSGVIIGFTFCFEEDYVDLVRAHPVLIVLVIPYLLNRNNDLCRFVIIVNSEFDAFDFTTF